MYGCEEKASSSSIMIFTIHIWRVKTINNISIKLSSHQKSFRKQFLRLGNKQILLITKVHNPGCFKKLNFYLSMSEKRQLKWLSSLTTILIFRRNFIYLNTNWICGFMCFFAVLANRIWKLQSWYNSRTVRKGKHTCVLKQRKWKRKWMFMKCTCLKQGPS